MAETPDKLVKAGPPEGAAPAPDPVTSRSTSGIVLFCALLLTGTLVWALWDEVYGMRPWKGFQQSFVKRYERYLKRIQKRGFRSEKEVRQSDEYRRLEAEAKAAREATRAERERIDARVADIDRRLAAISEPFQDRRGRITVASYEVETADEHDREDLRRDLEKMKAARSAVYLPAEGGGDRQVRQELSFGEMEAMYLSLKDEKGRLLAEKGELLKPASEKEQERDAYLRNNVTEATEQQVKTLRASLDSFDFGLKQINVNGDQLVDRCETCHLGTRSPIKITAADMMPLGTRRRPDKLARAFISHPSKELLDIHDPEKFGCSSCHWGNGRATTTEEKGHGRNRFWTHPLFSKENTEAGCNQCHSNDRVLQGAPVLTQGKDLFYERGCVGCHRYEGFDRESDALTNTRQSVKQLEDELVDNEREVKVARAESAAARSDEEARRLLQRAESLTVTNSQLESRIDQLNTQARYLMQDQKKVGPNLKDVRLKLRKEWIPEWLRDPQSFRPGTKMPTFWYLSGQPHGIVPPTQQDEERKAIAAYLWQAAFEGQVPAQAPGDRAKGEELFNSRGCLACHSVGEGDQKLGGDFAANLTRLGQKANYDYIVRWVHNPRERWAPYCPKEKRDLSPDDYKKHNLPFTFDTVRHSKCPNDGAELQVQNMTVMPNFRLTDQDARDIATYLMSLAPPARYPDAPYMDDPSLREKGKTLIKAYGCAGCHEIRGFEEEQRIGKELTAEGSTPLERLDFALMTHKAERGEDPYEEGKPLLDPVTKKPAGPWYNRKGFFEFKIMDPGVYDRGKEKDPRDHLRMPTPFLTPEWRRALTTFLLGSVGAEGANVPASLFYNPTDQQKAIQDGWWVIKKYNCMGCHSVQVGQASDLSRMALYQEGGPLGRDQLPPGLMTEGARVDPEWLLRFLSDPSLSGYTEGIDFGPMRGGSNPHSANGGGAEIGNPGRAAGGSTAARGPSPNGSNAGAQAAPNNQVMGALKPQPGADRNGVRRYLKARMPTFNFSPNELRTLVRFFLAVSSQQETYIREQQEPLTEGERNLARALFTHQAAPCLKCHMTGEPSHDQTATAPNFLDASVRLKPDWTFRWLLDPQRIMPGTAMPSDLFKRDGDRWVFNNPPPPGREREFEEYKGDHARLLTRYLLQLTPEEQARARSAQRVPAPSGVPVPETPVARQAPPAEGRTKAAARRARRRDAAALRGARHRRGREAAAGRKRAAGRWRQAASSARASPRDFSP